MLTSCSSPTLFVHRDGLARNVSTLSAHARAGLIAVVKAQGYGHGALEVAQSALAGGAQALGVTTICEGVQLRAHLPQVPILTWLNPPQADWAQALAARLTVAVPSCEHLRAVAAAAAQTGLCADVHLYADLGLARDGCPPAQWKALVEAARHAELAKLVRVSGLMGHLGCAAQPGHRDTDAALDLFATATAVAHSLGLHPRTRHVAATAATLTDARTHFDACRVGAGLVGIDPSGTTALAATATLAAPVIMTREVSAGTPVGYDHLVYTKRAMRLATIGLGYADGISRHARGAAVSIGGSRCPLVGPVSMDQIVVEAPHARAGEVAIIFGPGGPSIGDWARWSGTIAHRILTGVGQRVTRKAA